MSAPLTLALSRGVEESARRRPRRRERERERERERREGQGSRVVAVAHFVASRNADSLRVGREGGRANVANNNCIEAGPSCSGSTASVGLDLEAWLLVACFPLWWARWCDSEQSCAFRLWPGIWWSGDGCGADRSCSGWAAASWCGRRWLEDLSVGCL